MTLVFVRWYTEQAVYLDGKLIWYGRGDYGWSLLTVLGYTCLYGITIPTHDIPPEYDREENGWWKPPPLLSTLKEQREAVVTRERREKVARLRKELAELERNGL